VNREILTEIVKQQVMKANEELKENGCVRGSVSLLSLIGEGDIGEGTLAAVVGHAMPVPHFNGAEEKARVWAGLNAMVRRENPDAVTMTHEVWAVKTTAKTDEDARLERNQMAADLADEPGRKELVMVLGQLAEGGLVIEAWEIVRDAAGAHLEKSKDMQEHKFEQNIVTPWRD